MKRWYLLSLVFLVLFSLWLVSPVFNSSSPAWMGAADGLMIARARFLEQGLGLGSWNRYWHLGIPGNHIGSPVIPWLISLLVSREGWESATEAFRLWRGMVAVGAVGSVVGVFLLVQELVGGKKKESNKSWVALVTAILLFLVPSSLVLFPQIWKVTRQFGWPAWSLFSPFYLGDGQRTIGFVLVLLGLIVVWKLIRSWSDKQAVLLSFIGTLILLVDSLSFLTLLLWIAVLLLATVVRPQLQKEGFIKLTLRLFVFLLFGALLTSFWFTPSLVFNLIGAPSLGGKPFGLVAVGLVRRFAVLLPALLGVLAARKWLRKANSVTLVGLMGLLLFESLTLASFIADTDFWTDYSRFGRSLDLSMALLLSSLVIGSRRSNLIKFGLLVMFMVLGLPFLLTRGQLMQSEQVLSETVEYRSGKALEWVFSGSCEDVRSCSKRAYLSGSSVFWLNSWFDITQVRGGNNQGSVNDWWPHGSFQIREGIDPQLSGLWLEALGVSHLLVHGRNSEEIYHDFRFPAKFSEMEDWEAVWEDKSDSIWEFTGESGLARKAEAQISKVGAPKKGDDLKELERYVALLGEPVKFRWLGKREFEVSADLKEGEVIRVAVAYTPLWRISDSSGGVLLRKDALGMILLLPGASGSITARLKFSPWLDVGFGVMFGIIALLVLLRKPKILLLISERVEHFFGKDTDLDKSAL